MIEDLREYLKRYGWTEDTPEAVDDAYYFSSGTMDEMAEIAAKVVNWMDDDTHDCSGEMRNCIVAWQHESGERR